ncbi:MAG: FAD-binding oxidoreductase [Pseudomonadota bacterium]
MSDHQTETDPPRITLQTPIAFQDALPDRVDVVIIGAGVVGIFSALYMSRRGLKVLVCEKGRVAAEQSSRNWGWIRQQGRDYAELPIMTHALGLWHEVNRETNGACGIRTNGTSYISTTEDGVAGHARFLEVAKQGGVDTRMLNQAEIDAMFGDQGDGRWVGGIHTANDACGEPWQAVPAVARLAHRNGALIRENCAVRALDVQAGSIKGVVTEAGRVACDQVVVASGAWSSLFLRRHGVEIPQLAVRSTVARTQPMEEFFSGQAADNALALRRRQDGGYTLAAGGAHPFYIGPDAFRRLRKYLPQLAHNWRTMRPRPAAPKGYPDAWGTKRTWSEDEITPFEQNRVLEPSADPDEVAKMQRRFRERFPKLGTPKIRSSWAGMIDAMPDVVPIVDRAPELDGLIIATGMSGHGFGIGPGFGDIVARMASGTAQEHEVKRFRFGRFTDGSQIELGPVL